MPEKIKKNKHTEGIYLLFVELTKSTEKLLDLGRTVVPILPESAYELHLPKMTRVKQMFEAPKIDDLVGELRNAFASVRPAVKPGMRVAVAVGSRGIANLAVLVKTLGEEIKSCGAIPFVVPAMGSHAGATAEGQRDFLAGYGISLLEAGIPVESSMEVVQVGTTEAGIPVFFDRLAFEADLVVPVARVKPHTDFKGTVESGLCKMLAIGLGKHKGCSRLHEEGFANFDRLVPAVAKVVLRHCKIGFGLAIVENAYDQTALIKIVPAEKFLIEEPELLMLAKKMMPRILVEDIDVLIVDEIGKDISGAGMDPNIVGRTTEGILPGFTGPSIQKIVVLDLTEKTHGNACGIGVADFITAQVHEKIDTAATYANCIASANPRSGAIPIVMQNEDEAIRAAVQTCTGIDRSRLKIVRIKSTLDLGCIEVSETILETIRNRPDISIDA